MCRLQLSPDACLDWRFAWAAPWSGRPLEMLFICHALYAPDTRDTAQNCVLGACVINHLKLSLCCAMEQTAWLAKSDMFVLTTYAMAMAM